MKWRKVPHFPKWVGYLDKRHVATLTRCPDGVMKVWLDGGDGFRECVNIAIRPEKLSQWKLFCEVAHHFLVEQISVGLVK